MADITPDVFKVMQSYGGLKEAYIEVDVVTAGDVLKFDANDHKVTEVQMVAAQLAADGSAVPYTIGGSDNNEITIGAGPSAEKLKFRIIWRAY